MSRQLHRLVWLPHGSRRHRRGGPGARRLRPARAAPPAKLVGGGKVTVSINCAPTQAQNPVQHKEWVEDVATFEKANPNITIKSVYNYPCKTFPTFTAQLRAGTEPNVFYIYFTDLPQVLPLARPPTSPST